MKQCTGRVRVSRREEEEGRNRGRGRRVALSSGHYQSSTFYAWVHIHVVLHQLVSATWKSVPHYLTFPRTLPAVQGVSINEVIKFITKLPKFVSLK
jgi:hypothetical protein